MDGDSSYVRAEQLALAGVETGADLNPEPLEAISNRAGRADAPCRTIEGRQSAIAERLDEPTPVPLSLASCQRIVP